MFSVKEAENLSPFELGLFLEKSAKKAVKNSVPLNAGRGNPNWTAAAPREAFFLLGLFAVSEMERVRQGELSGMPARMEMLGRFEAFLAAQKETPGKNLLVGIWGKGERILGADKHDWLFEFVDAITGDNYPNPDRVLNYVEKAIKAYLEKEIFEGLKRPFDIFAVEGGTAGICYLFDSLVSNFLLQPGDKIALMIPTFTPYLEIPQLSRYRFDVVQIRSTPELIDGRLTYQFNSREIEKLRDSSIKAVFMVNPSNPSSSALKEETILQLKDIVQMDNPDLMILTDDVYGTFVPKFQSVFSVLPFNTACIYSFSKYFGATGWRLGTIALAEKNVFDAKLKRLSQEFTRELEIRYEVITKETEKFKFIDRLVADSREVALNHAAGLSTPQQVQMALFSLFSLLDEEESYKKKAQTICRYRQKLLYEELDLVMPFDHYDSAYYCEFDLLDWMKTHFGEQFGLDFQKETSITNFLMRLALEHGLVLLKGSGFGGSEWSVRISLANLETKDYKEIGRRIKKMVSDEFLKWQFERGQVK